MTYQILEFPSFCGGRIVHGVSNITVAELTRLRTRHGPNGALGRHLFAIIVIKLNGRSTLKLLDKFKKYGWKTHGRSFVNPITGNRVQMIKL